MGKNSSTNKNKTIKIKNSLKIKGVKGLVFQEGLFGGKIPQWGLIPL